MLSFFQLSIPQSCLYAIALDPFLKISFGGWYHFNRETLFFARLPPIKFFVLTGALDGLTTLIRYVAIPHLPGPFVQILPETGLIFSATVGWLFLKSRYSFWQVWSIFILVCGIIIVVLPSFTIHGNFQINPLYIILMAISPAPQAISFAVKEHVFSINRDLDVFVLQSFGSIFQLIWTPIFSPLSFVIDMTITQGMPFRSYLMNALVCFGGHAVSNNMSDMNCSYNPFPYMVYIVFNICFNIGFILVLRKASAVLSYMV